MGYVFAPNASVRNLMSSGPPSIPLAGSTRNDIATPFNPPQLLSDSGFASNLAMSSGEMVNPAKLHGGTTWAATVVTYMTTKENVESIITCHCTTISKQLCIPKKI